jgi:hypothetical protein
MVECFNDGDPLFFSCLSADKYSTACPPWREEEASISFLDSSSWVNISFSPPWRGRLWLTDKLLISSPSGVSTKLIFTLGWIDFMISALRFYSFLSSSVSIKKEDDFHEVFQ